MEVEAVFLLADVAEAGVVERGVEALAEAAAVEVAAELVREDEISPAL